MRIAPRNVVLAGVLALLVALQFIGGPKELPGREITRLLPDLVPSEVARFEVLAGERRVELARVDGEWSLSDLGNFPAERQLVERVLQVLGELTTLDLLTEDAKRHVEYGLDEATAQRLRIFGADDAPLADLLIGRAPSGSAFVRRVGDDAVYGASTLPRTSSDVQGWQRAVALIPIEPTLVTSLELSGPELGGPDTPLVLRRDKDLHTRWFDAAGNEVPRKSAEGLVNALMTLYVDRVLAPEVDPDEGPGLGRAPVRFTVRVTAADRQRGEVVEAWVGHEPQDGLVPAVGPAGPWVLGLREASVARILQHAAPLRR